MALLTQFSDIEAPSVKSAVGTFASFPNMPAAEEATITSNTITVTIDATDRTSNTVCGEVAFYTNQYTSTCRVRVGGVISWENTGRTSGWSHTHVKWTALASGDILVSITDMDTAASLGAVLCESSVVTSVDSTTTTFDISIDNVVSATASFAVYSGHGV